MISSLNNKGYKFHFLIFLFILLFPGILNIYAQKPANPYALTDEKAMQIPFAETASTEGIAGYINANFKSGTEKIRAVYTWIAMHIAYDIDKIFVVSYDESERDKISQTLKSRKGICENYSALFQDLCMKTGILCYLVEGYTKQNGLLDQIPHSWCTAYIEGHWLMFDPTWGSGYISQRKFIRQFNNDYFMVKPADMVKTHLPFDYLWQFPETDSISAYEKLNKIAQNEASIRRIEQNGIKNKLVKDRLKFLRQELEIEQQNVTVRQYNAAVADYNKGVSHLNFFVQYRNRQFTPSRPVPEIREMIDSAIARLVESLDKLNEIRNPDPKSAASISSLAEICQAVLVQAKEQQKWLNDYLGKGKY